MKAEFKFLLISLIITSFSIYSISIGDLFWGWIGLIFFGYGTLFFSVKLIFPKNSIVSSNKIHNSTKKVEFEDIYNDNGIFEYFNSGFEIKIGEIGSKIQWNEIETIFGYKVDRFSFDTICMDVFCDNDQGFRITEETPGWFQFLRHLKEKIQQVDKKWESEIAVPVFETKLTLVFDRENRTLEEAIDLHYKN